MMRFAMWLVHLLAEEDDPLPQQQREDVERPITASGLVEHGRYQRGVQGHRPPRSLVATISYSRYHIRWVRHVTRATTRSGLPGLQGGGRRRRALAGALADERVALGLSQTEVAARMGTSQSAVARLESGDADIRLSTLERYVAALGHRLDVRLQRRPPVNPDDSRPRRLVAGAGSRDRVSCCSAARSTTSAPPPCRPS